MNARTHSNAPLPNARHTALKYLAGLILYLIVMFAIREIWFADLPFMANGLFWSFTTLILASLLMRERGVSWPDLGLRRPDSIKKTLFLSLAIPLLAVAFIAAYNILKNMLGLDLAPDTSTSEAPAKFGELKDNYLHLMMILPIVWLQSALEEILDRAFLITWIERVFSSTLFATILAVLLQAVIFGFRHSYDLSDRSITVALIGLAMGIAYVAFGRNLWPLIFAHCLLNTMSMIERV